MNERNKLYKDLAGFSLIELVIAMAITLVVLGMAVTSFSSAMSSRERESSKTDAITSTQAALNIMSREIGNAGFGLNNNGLGWTDSAGVFHTDCTNQRLHFRANVVNNDTATDDPDEDLTFYFETASSSVVRYDVNLGTTTTSGLINRISNVEFKYWNYDANGTPTSSTVPTANTSRITVILTVTLGNVAGQPSNQTVQVKSDVTLRNSPYMLGQY